MHELTGRWRWRRNVVAAVTIALAAVSVVVAPPSTAEPAEATGETPYAVAAEPTVRIVPAADGTPLFTETYLPVPKDGATPPAELPVVLVYTPYGSPGTPEVPDLIDLLVPRGYAVTFANVRGSGGSGGCFTFGGQAEVGDGARIVEDAGELAPWSSGVVGMFGASYPGGTQLATATGPDRDRLESLDALVIGAPAASFYDFVHHDGVPHFLQGPGSTLTYFASLTSPTADLSHLADRPGCALDVVAGASNISGDYTPYWAARDHARHLERLEAATFMFHGTADRRVPQNTQAGLFDRLPTEVPKFGMFGVWGHEYPPREDFAAMVVDWYDSHLRDVDNGVDDWPVVEVQSTDGTWSNVSDWPTVPGSRDEMLLGPGGTLDASAPTGSTTYLETPTPEVVAADLGPLATIGDALNTAAPITATFETPPADQPYRIVGAADLDLWVELTVPDAHIAVRLEVIGPDGTRVVSEARTMGARSAQHIDPRDREKFRQVNPVPPPTGTPILVPVHLDPIDLAVPAGSHLRLAVAGTSIAFDGLDGVAPGLGAIFQGPTWPSGLIAPVRILHDADHPSALSFVSRPS